MTKFAVVETNEGLDIQRYFPEKPAKVLFVGSTWDQASDWLLMEQRLVRWRNWTALAFVTFTSIAGGFTWLALANG